MVTKINRIDDVETLKKMLELEMKDLSETFVEFMKNPKASLESFNILRKEMITLTHDFDLLITLNALNEESGFSDAVPDISKIKLKDKVRMK